MKRLLSTLTIVSLSLPGTTYSQQDDVKLDDIIVTARKKKENLQEVPISATSFNDQQIEAAGIESVRDVADLTPNVNIVGSTSGRYITPYIRGQGNQDLNLPDEVSVSFYLDEVPLPRYAFDNELVDIEKIEVLRGPQGTLFGKNTQAGAINIVTKDPNVNDGHQISGEYGNLDTYAVGGVTNFKLGSDKLTNRMAIKYKERGGFINDTLQKRELGEMETLALGNTLLFKPSESFKVAWKIGVQDEDGTDPMIVARGVNGYPKTGQDIVPNYNNHLYTTSVRAERDFGDTVLTTIAAFNYHDFNVKYDESDFYLTNDTFSQIPGGNAYVNDTDILYRDIKEFERQYFGEVRLSNKDDDFAWTVGANFAKNNYRLVTSVNTIENYFPTSFKDIHQNIQLLTTNIGIFGEATKQLPKDFSVTAGARILHDQKEFKSYHSSPALTEYRQESEKDYTDYTAKLALEHETTQNINSYVSFARGYQSGGFPSFQINNYSDKAIDQPAYGESSSLNYEVGVKSKLLNERLRVNAAIFFNDVQDKQVRIRDASGNSYYANIDTDIFGGEIESELKITRDITFGANAGYTNAKFQENVMTFNSSGTTESVDSAKGARLANIPYWSGSSFIEYSRYFVPVNGVIFARATYKYMGDRFGDNTNQTLMGSYGLWSFRLGLDKEHYTIVGHIDNAFDKVYESQAYYYSSLQTEVSSPALPRLYGIKATIRF